MENQPYDVGGKAHNIFKVFGDFRRLATDTVYNFLSTTLQQVLEAIGIKTDSI